MWPGCRKQRTLVSFEQLVNPRRQGLVHAFNNRLPRGGDHSMAVAGGKAEAGTQNGDQTAGSANSRGRCLKVKAVPWCQILIDDPAARDERSFKRLMRNLPAAGDLIEVEKETVVVTSVSLIPPITSQTERVTALVYCRRQE